MGLVYHNGEFIPEEHIEKSDADTAALQQLRSFLDANEPGIVRFLVHTWRSQGQAITYKELREAIMAGELSTEYLYDWMQDYSKLVAEKMQPEWEKAINAGVEELNRKYPTFYFDPMADGVRSWVESRAAEFVTNVTTTQIEGLRALVQRAAVLEDLTVDELARAIRPMVGLTKPMTDSCMNYYETLRANKVTPKRARERTYTYAARRHRERAYNIATTELATAYNRGAHEGTLQAQAAGMIGPCKKVWVTARDERVCGVCNSLNGTEWDMDADIMYEHTYKTGMTVNRRINRGLDDPEAGKTPPAHPRCRCVVKYVEIEPPKF